MHESALWEHESVPDVAVSVLQSSALPVMPRVWTRTPLRPHGIALATVCFSPSHFIIIPFTLLCYSFIFKSPPTSIVFRVRASLIRRARPSP